MRDASCEARRPTGGSKKIYAESPAAGNFRHRRHFLFLRQGLFPGRARPGLPRKKPRLLHPAPLGRVWLARMRRKLRQAETEIRRAAHEIMGRSDRIRTACLSQAPASAHQSFPAIRLPRLRRDGRNRASQSTNQKIFTFEPTFLYKAIDWGAESWNRLPFGKPYFWLLLCLAWSAAAFGIPNEKIRRVTLALTLSGAMYTLAFAAIGIASDYRYIDWTMLCALIATP